MFQLLTVEAQSFLAASSHQPHPRPSTSSSCTRSRCQLTQLSSWCEHVPFCFVRPAACFYSVLCASPVSHSFDLPCTSPPPKMCRFLSMPLPSSRKITVSCALEVIEPRRFVFCDPKPLTPHFCLLSGSANSGTGRSSPCATCSGI